VLLCVQVLGFTMAFISVLTRNIIRRECKWYDSIKLVRQLSAAEASVTDKAEDARRYVPRYLYYYLLSNYTFGTAHLFFFVT